MTKRKSARERLADGRQPHIVDRIPPGAPGYREANGGRMVVSSPSEVDDLVRRLHPGELITLGDLRAALARRHAVAVACPVSTAIFLNISARAAEEARALGENLDQLTPWWRVLSTGGFLNPRFPGGVDLQAVRLAAEGVKTSSLKGGPAVLNFEQHRPEDPLEARPTEPRAPDGIHR